MNHAGQLCVKLLHCGNNSLANPQDQCEKDIFFMPMGLLALASALTEAGIDAEIIHSDCERGKVIDELLGFSDLDVVAFDCHWVNQSLPVLETADLVKRIRPDVFILLGGFTASFFAEEILLNHPQVDAIIKGDADVPIVKLCEAHVEKLTAADSAIQAGTGRFLRDVPNLIWRDENGKIHANQLSYVATAEDMERLDFACLDLLRNWEYYRKRSIYWTHFAPLNFAPLNLSPLFFLEIGRGCTNTCLSCGGSAEAQRIINNRETVAVRSVDSVIATVKKAMSFGFRTFFTDFEFVGSDEWYMRLFTAIRADGLDIHYVYSSWALTSIQMVDALSHSFERAFIQLSPESGDVELRRKNKGARAFYSNQQLRECLDYIGTKGNLKVQLYFGYFLAFESSETVLTTLKFIMELLLAYPDLVEIGYLPFSTDPASLLFLHPERYDVSIAVRSFQDYVHEIREAYIEKKSSSPDLRLLTPNGISRAESAVLERRIELFSYMFQSYRKSISRILQGSGGREIVLNILRETDIAVAEGVAEEVRKVLLDDGGGGGVRDALLAETIDAECEMEKRRRRQSFKAKPQIWLDSAVETRN